MLGGALSSRDTSRESTPMDATGTSAENSDVSDTDGKTHLFDVPCLCHIQ